jgi:hypothetical protein
MEWWGNDDLQVRTKSSIKLELGLSARKKVIPTERRAEVLYIFSL